jgi:hypothetical protein
MSRCVYWWLGAGLLALSGCRSEGAPDADPVRVEHAPTGPSSTVAALAPPQERVESASLDAGTLLAPAWSATAAMHVARQNQVASLLQNGSVLVAGGHPGNNISTATAEIYSPSTRTWTSVGSRVRAA